MDTSLAHARITKVNLNGAVVRHTTMQRADLRNVDFTGAKLVDCSIAGLTIDGISVEAALEHFKAHPPATA